VVLDLTHERLFFLILYISNCNSGISDSSWLESLKKRGPTRDHNSVVKLLDKEIEPTHCFQHLKLAIKLVELLLKQQKILL
jgi:hypothetical protein